MNNLKDGKTAGGIVVITGGTRGIGAGLVRAFLDSGWLVHFTGRSAESVASAREKIPSTLATRAFGHACLADDPIALLRVWEAAARDGRVDLVICNAGLSKPRPDFGDYDMDSIREVVATNILGPMAAAKLFLPLMRAQGGGFFYAMEGFGSRGELQDSLTLYGTTKYALAYFLRALARENKGGNVSIGALSPGMVITDLLLASSGGLAGLKGLDEGRRRIFSILADRVETVAPWLVAKVIADVAAGSRPGTYKRFNWLSRTKVLFRFLTSGFVKRGILD